MQQALLHENQRHPYVLGSDYRYLTHNSKLYRCQAEYDGDVLYSDNGIMIVVYYNNKDFIIYEVPEYMKTKSLFNVKLQHKREEGKFKKGDLLYYYNGFSDQNTPIYGHNFNTLYNSLGGYTYEDAMVISESAANKLKHRKIEKIIIPIHDLTFMKPIHDGNFLPSVGSIINKTVATEIDFNNNGENIINVQSLNTLLNGLSDDVMFNTENITTKLKNPIVTDVKVHKMNSFGYVVLNELKNELDSKSIEYESKINNIKEKLTKKLGDINKKYIFYNIINKYYKIINPKHIIAKHKNKHKNILYIVEIDLLEDSQFAEKGDKITNRYGGKGIISAIIPDNLMPVDEYGNKVDCIVSPLSIFGRTNFGQAIEGLISRVVNYVEKEIIKDSDIWINELIKLMDVIKDFDNKYYLDAINQIDNIKTNTKFKSEFRNNVISYGLYIECPLFYNINLSSIRDNIYEKFQFKSNINIKFSRDFLKTINDNLNLDMPLPDEYYEINNALCIPVYVLKLHKLAHELARVRDIGNVNNITNINTETESGAFRGTKVGYMETFALASSGAYKTLREMRNCKSDNKKEKLKFHSDYISTGEYLQDETRNNDDPPIKKIVEAYMTGITKG